MALDATDMRVEVQYLILDRLGDVDDRYRRIATGPGLECVISSVLQLARHSISKFIMVYRHQDGPVSHTPPRRTSPAARSLRFGCALAVPAAVSASLPPRRQTPYLHHDTRAYINGPTGRPHRQTAGQGVLVHSS